MELEQVAEQSNGSDKGFYSVISPSKIRSNSKLNVTVSIHKCNQEECEVEITLNGPSYEDSKRIQIKPMSIGNVEFDIPTIYDGNYNLIAEGINGIVFKETKRLSYAEYGPLVLLQTDKATYKPGDMVQFRVIFMDDRTRPIEPEKSITIAIKDGEENRLKQWQNVELKRGVYVGKYQLSEQPVLGRWTIEVNSEGRTLKSKLFEVDKYVLPKFDVSIETAKDVAIHDDIINATIRSKYTYGKGVKGKATVSIKSLYLFCGMAGSNQLTVEKTISIDGRGEVQFKIADDLKIPRNASPCLQLTAVMKEELTGNTQETSATVQLHAQRYRFVGLDVPSEFYPNKPLRLKVAVKYVDDTPVIDSANEVKLRLEKQQSYFRSGIFSMAQPIEETDKSSPIELIANLNDEGIATFEYNFPEDSVSWYNLNCEYKECQSSVGTLRKHENSDNTEEINEPLELIVLTKKPQLGKAVEVQLKSNEEISYFVYTITGRGKILKTEMVTLEIPALDYRISIDPTFDMIPKAAIFVHYVAGKDLKYKEIDIKFEKQFENFIDICAPAEAKLGEEIPIEINSNSDSYIGILGVDQSVLLLRAGNDITMDSVFDGLDRYNSISPLIYRHSVGSSSGLIVLTNAKYKMKTDNGVRYCRTSVSTLFGSANVMPYRLMQCSLPENLEVCENMVQAPAPVIQIRKEFPENWIFENIECLTDGSVTISKTVPDTITSWVITGFSLNADTGFAVTKNPSTIKTFRPFFIATNLPYSLKRGEQFSLPVLIFNYMDQDLDAHVTLDNADNEFEFIEAGDDETNRRKKLTIAANNGGSVNFIIRPKIIGQITLKITATSALAGDAIHKKLKVEPEGITIFKNTDYYLHADEGLVDISNTVKLDIPENVVSDSELIEVSVMGNILGSTISNIDKLVRMPYGCGEQNMVNFVPNIFVLWYLESIEELSTYIEEKAKRFLEIGYQRELTYKHDNGSYSAFGKSDSSGSTWLTAYVMRSLHQAKKYIDIDGKILEQGLDFLAKTQAPNGCFPEVGRVLDFSHMSVLGLTAFVLLAFLENEEYSEKHQETIDRGFEYLQQNVMGSEDLYSLAISLFALQKRQSEIVNDILSKLETFERTNGGGLKWWSKKTSDNEKESCSHSSSHDIEITGYILMTLLEMNQSVLPITKWLISQRNSNGGFESTQETVVGLWALIRFAEKSGCNDPNMSVCISSVDDESNSKTFDINKENSMLVQSWQLPNETREIKFNGKGSGTAIIQVSSRYNILEREPKPSFKLSSEIKPKSVPGRLCMDVYAEFVPTEEENLNTSNMVVMEVVSPSGYTFPQSFDKIKEINSVKRIETKDGDTRLVIYFDNLKVSEVKCIPIEAELSHVVAGQKPVPIVIYDYYDNKRRATDFYHYEDAPNEIPVARTGEKGMVGMESTIHGTQES